LNSIGIAIFVKTPELSSVKTRLAATIGSEKAEQFYRLAVKAIEQTVATVCADKPITPYWAIAEKQALDRPIWSGFTCLYGGSDDLGLSQHKIYKQLLERHQRVILIGADSPQLSSTQIQQAIDSLEDHSYAIGPALDGGYYLFAGKTAIDQKVWTSVKYSCATTASQLSYALPSAPVQLMRLTDVDREEDLALLLEQLCPAWSNQAQLLLRDWLVNLNK
jgi:rSAM/selenodomain-associated transferase 1|tara:strand:- start:2302 stop:2961 length:660 start_codon:yes stop_codon:yes gene_type:complete